jgi:putative IMPACT (imprinted ancient) family translation regulator
VYGCRFLAHAAPAADEEAAKRLLLERQAAYHDATHHGSAWRLHAGGWRANDAGEPSGSTGAPILSAIDGAGLEDCAVVVTRYYGGTKLGVGGLVRAYGEAAGLALEAAPRLRAIPAVRLRIVYPYDRTATVLRLLERLGMEDARHLHGAEGAEVRFTLPAPEAGRLPELLREQSGGALAPELLRTTVLHRPPSTVTR